MKKIISSLIYMVGGFFIVYGIYYAAKYVQFKKIITSSTLFNKEIHDYAVTNKITYGAALRKKINFLIKNS